MIFFNLLFQQHVLSILNVLGDAGETQSLKLKKMDGLFLPKLCLPSPSVTLGGKPQVMSQVQFLPSKLQVIPSEFKSMSSLRDPSLTLGRIKCRAELTVFHLEINILFQAVYCVKYLSNETLKPEVSSALYGY